MYTLNSGVFSPLTKVFLAAGLLLALFFPATSFAESEETPIQALGGTVTSAAELNQALGGIHQTEENTVILQQDVVLESRIDLKAAASLTLNLNGKTIRFHKTDEAGYCAINMESDLVINGNGTIEADGTEVSAIAPGGRCSLTIHNAEIQNRGWESCGIKAVGSAADRIHINLTGVRMQAPWDSIRGEGAVVNLSVKDTVIKGGVSLQFPETYMDNIEAISGDYNTVVFNGGTATRLGGEMTKAIIKAGTIQSINFSCRSHVYMRGGTVSKCRLNDIKTTMKMSGGTVYGVDCHHMEELTLTGGVIAGTGVDLDGGRLVMKGGTIQASDREALKLCPSLDDRFCTATISGGTIQTSKNGARGISIDGTSTLTLKGGIIKSTAPKSTSAGIYASGSKAKVALKGTKNSPAYVKGYKYSLYKKGSAAFSISKNTKVFAPKVRKSGYIRGQKLPKSIKGNLSVTYKKL
ncbi:MAG: hypothetical protein HFE76_03255 [Firmicutes bacterium]|nr:hypothetical protein [Bacillota bacterium]